MRKLIPSGMVLAGGLVAALQASPVVAQETIAMMTSARSGPVEKATELERKAEELYSHPARYSQAARLLIRAAELRSIDDPVYVTNLSMAARLYFYAGEKLQAFELMERAATAALSRGDVLTAAHAFVDASHLAALNGLSSDVTRLVERARLLTASPLLADRERAGVKSRLESAIS